jgi:glycolate oxidase iron-sulfur subunit
MAEGYQGLDACVHCGFCLPACPTYLATGDENESPRGRIVLMRALERGRSDPAIRDHLDSCLGCLGCEPACPSGVRYGEALQTAREALFQTGAPDPLRTMLLATFQTSRAWRPLFTIARWIRHTGLPRLMAGSGAAGFVSGMLAASAPGWPGRIRRASIRPGSGPTVGLFRGCVMDTLFPHVHGAVERTLTANGYRVVDLPGQGCCGALHEHAGDEEQARELARQNVAAFPEDVDFLVVDSAGCGALLRTYDRLLGQETGGRLASRVRDVSELLTAAGPRMGGPVAMRVAYDAPCHLHHAQRVVDAPQTVLAAIPELDVVLADGWDRCCGSAGLYSLAQPDQARAILADKLGPILDDGTRIDAVATGNPGCLMHIGAGLLAAGSTVRVVHPVELLDLSYQAAGIYREDVSA